LPKPPKICSSEGPTVPPSGLPRETEFAIVFQCCLRPNPVTGGTVRERPLSSGSGHSVSRPQCSESAIIGLLGLANVLQQIRVFPNQLQTQKNVLQQLAATWVVQNFKLVHRTALWRLSLIGSVEALGKPAVYGSE